MNGKRHGAQLFVRIRLALGGAILANAFDVVIASVWPGIHLVPAALGGALVFIAFRRPPAN